MKEMERAWEQLQDELRKKEAEYEEKLVQIRQQQTSKVRWVLVGLGGCQPRWRCECAESSEGSVTLLSWCLMVSQVTCGQQRDPDQTPEAAG